MTQDTPIPCRVTALNASDRRVPTPNGDSSLPCPQFPANVPSVDNTALARNSGTA